MEVEDEEAYHHNIQASIVFCLQNPQWRLSLQTHKIIGIS
jgi:organic radical activating enzyme